MSVRRRFALVIACLCVAAPLHAEGLNLSWDDCGAHGAENKTFACNSNRLAGGGALFASFQPPAGTTAITGEEIVIDLYTSWNQAIPSWWQFQYAGACRRSALSASANVSTEYWNCADYWMGLSVGNITAYISPYQGDASHARLLAIFAIPTSDARPMDENTEYFAARFYLTGIKTVGDGACGGCLEPICIQLTRIKLSQPITAQPYDYDLWWPLERSYVRWQSEYAMLGCGAVIPTRNTTWGAIKSQYR